MPLSVRVSVICDDVRQEMGNKLTLVGLYNDRITFPAGSAPHFGVPKLMSVFIVTGFRGVRRLAYRHTVTVVGALGQRSPAEDQPLVTITRLEEAVPLDEHNFITMVVPAVFASSPSYLRATLRVELESGESLDTSRDVEVIRLPPGNPVPPGSVPGPLLQN